MTTSCPIRRQYIRRCQWGSPVEEWGTGRWPFGPLINDLGNGNGSGLKGLDRLYTYMNFLVKRDGYFLNTAPGSNSKSSINIRGPYFPQESIKRQIHNADSSLH